MTSALASSANRAASRASFLLNEPVRVLLQLLAVEDAVERPAQVDHEDLGEGDEPLDRLEQQTGVSQFDAPMVFDPGDRNSLS